MTFISCTTTKTNSVSENQEKVALIRELYLLNSITSFDSEVFNNMDIKNIIGADIDKLRLVENEVPYLKENLTTFDIELHTAFRLASISYQEILLKYSNELNMPILYPYNNNYYISEDNELTVLFNTFGDEINEELTQSLEKIFENSFKEYKILATNYNIYSSSLATLGRTTLTPIDINIKEKVFTIFKQTVNSSIINIEETYQFEKTSINPDNIIITN